MNTYGSGHPYGVQTVAFLISLLPFALVALLIIAARFERVFVRPGMTLRGQRLLQSSRRYREQTTRTPKYAER